MRPSRLVVLLSLLVSACASSVGVETPPEILPDAAVSNLPADAAVADPADAAIAPDAAVASDAGPADAADPDAALADDAGPADVGAPDAALAGDAGSGDACTPTTCKKLGATCGSVPDGCGGTLSCGSCPSMYTCGGGGQANVCGANGCSARTCDSAGFTCGTWSDNCAGTVTCGKCGNGLSCVRGACSLQKCTPTTCAALGYKCGQVPDGCGGLLTCGPCNSPETCGGGGRPGLCGCTRKTCAQLGLNCGKASDGCGGTLDCGGCQAPQTCGGGGKANVCGCTPLTCAANECGAKPDGCGGIAKCPVKCASGETCGGGGVNRCGFAACTPLDCKKAGNKNCGEISDGCGSVLSCGTCANGATCGAGGTPNVCACPTNVCTQAGYYCGTVSNGCATLSCGMCSGTDTCGGGGVTNVCGCTAKTCADLNADCGVASDGCGHVLSCGSCAGGLTCGGGGTTGRCGRTPFCSADGFCWSNGLPQGNELLDVWVGPTEVFAVGAAGTILFNAGGASGWQQLASGTTVKLYGVSGTSYSDVWAVGEAGTILHFDGSTWTRKPSPTAMTLYGVSAFSSSFAVAVGANGEAARWDGSSWKPITKLATDDLRGVWARTATDVWAVGGRSVQRYDGTKWSAVTVPACPGQCLEGRSLAAVHGSSGSDVWVADARGKTLRFDGATWSTVTDPFMDHFEDVAVVAPNDVWAVVHRFDSTSHYVSRALYHWNGAAWTEVLPGERWLNAVSAGASGRVWAAGRGGYAARVAGGALDETFSFWPLQVNALWGSSASDVWAVGGSDPDDAAQFAHFNGYAWTRVTASMNAFMYLSAWGSGPNDVWLGGRFGALQHWDGVSLVDHTFELPPDNIDAIQGFASNDVWFLCDTYVDAYTPGDFGTRMHHWDGSSFSPRYDFPSIRNVRMHALWGANSKDIWAVGDAGTVVHWDGIKWTTVSFPSTTDLLDVRGASATTFWIVGRKGEVYLSNGTNFLKMNYAALGTGDINRVWPTANDVYFIGDRVVRMSGSTFQQVQLPIGETMRAAWGVPGTSTVFFGGDQGAVVTHK